MAALVAGHVVGNAVTIAANRGCQRVEREDLAALEHGLKRSRERPLQHRLASLCTVQPTCTALAVNGSFPFTFSGWDLAIPHQTTPKTLFTPLWPGLQPSDGDYVFMCLAPSFLRSPAVRVTRIY